MNTPVRTLATFLLVLWLAACGAQIPCGAAATSHPADASPDQASPPCVLEGMPCRADTDCPAQSRCNFALERGVCQRLRCGAPGSPSSSPDLCAAGPQMLSFVGDYFDPTRYTIRCAGGPSTTRSEYAPCNDLAHGTPCGAAHPGIDQHYSLFCVDETSDVSVPSPGAPTGRMCVNYGCDFGCAMGPGGAAGRCINLGPSRFYDRPVTLSCAFECTHGQCPAGFRCTSMPGTNLERDNVDVCLPVAD